MELTGECSRRSGGSQHKHAKELFEELALLFDQKGNNENFEKVKEDTSEKSINGPNVKTEAYGSAYIESEMYGRYAFLNIEDGQEEDDEFKKSKRNIVEAAVVLHMLSKLCKVTCSNWTFTCSYPRIHLQGWPALVYKLICFVKGVGQYYDVNSARELAKIEALIKRHGGDKYVCAHRSGPMISVGVISPYSAQVSYLKSRLMKNNKWRNNIDVEVRTLDGFQTREKDIIIISTVSTNNIGILSDSGGAYFALKCARLCLWIVGNGSVLVKSKSIWEKLAKDAIAGNCFLDPNKYTDMVKVIRNAKAEIESLQDLLKTDSILFNNTLWKVTFSSDFKNSFTKLKGLYVRQHIINTILKLANGWRKKWKHAGSSQKDLINEYATSGLYLVWTTDVERQEEVMQVLKIWNVLNLVEVSRLRENLELLFATYTPQYIERCKAKLLDKNAKAVLPMRWKDDPGFVWYKHMQRLGKSENIHSEGSGKKTVILEHGKVEESLLLMKFYSLSSGIANQLLTAKDGSEIALQFEVNDEESRIIRFPRSSFILGRSGTGKTTVLTARLLQKEQQFNLSIHGFSAEKQTRVESTIGRVEFQREYLNSNCLRQMFVTVSARLCSAISNHIRPIDNFVRGKGHTFCMKMHDNDNLQDLEDIPDNFIDIDDKHFPMVITFQKFLIMLDGSVQCPFFRNRCTEEQKYHFGAQRSEYKRSLALMQIMRKNEVNYERFDSFFWPHFSADLRRGLESSVVFTEIISHIKGSSLSLVSPDFKMVQDDYIKMAECRTSTLSVEQREAVYKIFMQYEKQKKGTRYFDVADVVNHLHCQIGSTGYLGKKMNFIYVDEVQDLPMAQISLFKYVCSNVRDGFVFAGDTAQTIARGVYFRFEDIRNLFYKEFLEANSIGYAKSKFMPDMFHLRQNFRTHAGITRLAQSVVEVLYYFFPFAVDKLSPEVSSIYGEAPIFINANDGESLFTTILSHENNFGRGNYEFGAGQVILVRDDNQKAQVLEQVGKQCLVLTILESKGLEFQDVLLYNFFSSSPLGMKWRVLYDFMIQKGFNSCGQNQYPKFDDTKHNLLCGEVKHLYVAITRSKERLWIYDENPQNAQPMLDYWKQLNIIQLRCLDRCLVESMYVVSSCEDWKQRGIQMSKEKKYDMAYVCFERARDLTMAKWAKAALLQQDGERNLQTFKEGAKSSLTDAAEIFLSIGRPELAANCFIILGNYNAAGRIYLENYNETRNEDAGDCFAEAKSWNEAAIAYARAKCLNKCLNACTKGKHFEIGLGLFQELNKLNCQLNCGRCDTCERRQLEIEYLTMSATHFHNRKDTKSMMKFVNALPTLDLVRLFLWNKDCFDELLEIEVANGDFVRAAEAAMMNGDLLLEADMLEKAEKYEQAIRVILLHVQLNSLRKGKSSRWLLKEFPGKDELLDKAKQIAKQNLQHLLKTLDCKVSILSDKSDKLSELTEQMILSEKMGNLNFEVLSLRKLLNAHICSDAKKFQHKQVRSLLKMDYNCKIALENRVSSQTMMFLWNEWKYKLLSLVNIFERLKTHPEKQVDKGYIEFTFEYFGARVSRSRSSIELHSESFLLKDRRIQSLQIKGKCAQISILDFYMHARESLLMELFSVGIKVVKKLQEIYLSCRNQHCICKGPMIRQIYEDLKILEDRNMDGFDRDELFFDIFFPLKTQYENTTGFIFLLESPTCSLILKDITVNIIRKIRTGINLGLIGKLQLLLPFLPKYLVTKYGEKIIKSLHDNNCWNDKLLWLHMGIITGVCLLDKRLLMLESFLKALHGTFKNWHNHIDYISPHVFLLLLEKLFFFSSCEHLSRSLFLPRCLFVEFMTGQQGNPSCAWLRQAQCVPRCHGKLENFYGPIFHIIYELLVTKKYATFKWMETFKMNIGTYFPEMRMRLITMLCLIGINSIQFYQDATHAILEIFQDRDIRTNPPSEFGGKLIQSLQNCNSNRDTLSIHFCRVMRDIGNPLVMIDLCGPKHNNSHGDFIVLGLDSIVSKKILFQTIFRFKGDLFFSNERDGHRKGKELPIHGEKNMQPSNDNNSITNTEYYSDNLKAGKNYATNTEALRGEQEKGNTSDMHQLGSGKMDEQKKGDGFGVAGSNENIQFSVLEINELAVKFEVDGQSVPLFVQWRMKRWLSCARSRLGQTLSFKDRYIREVCRALQWNKNYSYAETFISKACPLKAEVDELLDLIETTIPKVKQGKVQLNDATDVIKEIHDICKDLSRLSELICPRHAKHEECDLQWLENDAIGRISIRLQESRHQLDRIKSEFEDDTLTVTESAQPLSSAQS